MLDLMNPARAGRHRSGTGRDAGVDKAIGTEGPRKHAGEIATRPAKVKASKEKLPRNRVSQSGREPKDPSMRPRCSGRTSGNWNMDDGFGPALRDGRNARLFHRRSDQLRWGLLFPLVFAGNLVVATAVWFIVGWFMN